MPNFDPFNAPTDTIYVSGHPSPGIAEVYDVKVVHNWRERRGYGFSGATLAYRGKALCRFKVKLTLITTEDFEAWEAFLPELAPPPPDPPTWTGDDAASLAFLENDLQADPNFELARLSRVQSLRARRTRAANAGRSQGRHLDVSHPILEGMAIVGAVQGEAMARRFAGMAAGANRAGHSVRALADDVRARLGGVAARRMLDLDVQMRRFHDSLGRIFGDLRIEGFLRALNEMTSMFSQSTATGRALKAIVETIFNPVLDAAGSGAPLVRRFFQGMVVGALLVTIGVIRLARLLQSVFGGSEILRGINAQRIAFGLGAAVVGAFVVTLAAAAAVAGLVVAAVGAITATVAAASAGILAGVAALAGLVAAGIRAVQWFRSTDFSSLGRSIVDGLIRGIQVGALRIPASMQNLAAQARGALEQALRMRSPSRVFAELGAQIPAGLAMGVESGSGVAQSAVDQMVEPRVSGLGGGGTTHVSIEGGIHVHAQSGDQAREIAESIHEQLAAVLEGLGASIGSSVPA